MAEKLIPTWKERLAHLDKPTDFAEAQAAKMEAAELRRYIRELESASQPGGGEAEDIDYTLTRGDMGYSQHWAEGRMPVEVVDVNWALRAIAIRLAPNGSIVVWPAAGLSRVAPSAGNGGAEGV